MSMSMTRDEFLGINRMDADELRETLSEVLERNAKLKALVEGMEWCKSEDADAKYCPLYDEDEPFRCKRERYLKEVGLAERVPTSWNAIRWRQNMASQQQHTVEDVLREFVAEFIEYATCVDDHEVTDAISEYAPKLRLAGEDE